MEAQCIHVVQSTEEMGGVVGLDIIQNGMIQYNINKVILYFNGTDFDTLNLYLGNNSYIFTYTFIFIIYKSNLKEVQY